MKLFGFGNVAIGSLTVAKAVPGLGGFGMVFTVQPDSDLKSLLEVELSLLGLLSKQISPSKPLMRLCQLRASRQRWI
jgi:hypothetical protein